MRTNLTAFACMACLLVALLAMPQRTHVSYFNADGQAFKVTVYEVPADNPTCDKRHSACIDFDKLYSALATSKSGFGVKGVR